MRTPLVCRSSLCPSPLNSGVATMMRRVFMLLVAVAATSATSNVSAQCAFSHQGRLKFQESPADGIFDFEFSLWTQPNGGGSVGSLVQLEDVVVTSGLFTVSLDFGCVFDNTPLWLETSIRAGATTDPYTLLSPRQPVKPTPSSSWAAEAGNADTVDNLHASELLDKATYDPDGDGKVGAAESADSAIEAATANNADTVDGQHASDFLQKSGGTMSGSLVLASDPTASLEAATKQYVDSTIPIGVPPSWSQILDSTDGNPATGCDSTRFKCVLGGEAVLDLETGLVWERTPSTSAFTGPSAIDHCSLAVAGGRGGWHLPRLQEFRTLIDYSSNPSGLPTGHPFATGSGSIFWSASWQHQTSFQARTDISTGTTAWQDEDNIFYRAWCVRGGSPHADRL